MHSRKEYAYASRSIGYYVDNDKCIHNCHSFDSIWSMFLQREHIILFI